MREGAAGLCCLLALCGRSVLSKRSKMSRALILRTFSSNTAAFEVKLLLGGRKIHGEWKAIAARRDSAQCIDNVLEPNVQPEPFSFVELVQAVTDELNKQTYDPRTREALDALLYVNLKGHFLDVQSSYTSTAAIAQMGWRAVSVLSPPYALVLTASPSAPVFLQQRVATVQNCCSNPDEWFAL